MICIAVSAVITHRTKSIARNGCRHDGNIPINPNVLCACKQVLQTQCLVGVVGNELLSSVLASMDVDTESPHGCENNFNSEEDSDSNIGFGPSKLGTKEL